MTTDRCHACGAAVTPGAPWCTLCYADLREPAVAPAVAEPAALPPDPILDAPLAPVAAPAAAAGGVAVATAPRGWPCMACGAVMSLDEDACTQCGRPFLPSEATPSLNLPVVGNVGRLDKTQRVVLMVVGVVLVTLACVVLAFLFGNVL